MEYKRFENIIYARIDAGEEIIDQLTQIAIKEKIKLANINALGATNNFTVGVYKVLEKQYLSNTFKGDFEIVSLHGTITSKNDKPYLHLHMACGDINGNVFGGHLNEAFVSATCEMVITISDGYIDRVQDPNIGLNLFDFKK